MTSKCDFGGGICNKDIGTVLPFFCDEHAEHVMDLNKRMQAENVTGLNKRAQAEQSVRSMFGNVGQLTIGHIIFENEFEDHTNKK